MHMGTCQLNHKNAESIVYAFGMFMVKLASLGACQLNLKACGKHIYMFMVKPTTWVLVGLTKSIFYIFYMFMFKPANTHACQLTWSQASSYGRFWA